MRELWANWTYPHLPPRHFLTIFVNINVVVNSPPSYPYRQEGVIPTKWTNDEIWRGLFLIPTLLYLYRLYTNTFSDRRISRLSCRYQLSTFDPLLSVRSRQPYLSWVCFGLNFLLARIMVSGFKGGPSINCIFLLNAIILNDVGGEI